MWDKGIILKVKEWFTELHRHRVEVKLLSMEAYGKEKKYSWFIRQFKRLEKKDLSKDQSEKLGTIVEKVYSKENFHKETEHLVKALYDQEGFPFTFKDNTEALQGLDSFIKNQDLFVAIAMAFAKAGKEETMIRDLCLVVYYIGETGQLKISGKRRKRLLFFLSDLLGKENNRDRISIDIYKRSLDLKWDPNIFFQLLESCFQLGMHEEVTELLARNNKGFHNGSLNINILEVGTKSHLQLNELYAHVVRGMYFKVLSESEDMGLKIKVAHFLCENLHILVEELQKEAIKAIEEGLFKEGVPDPKIVEGVLSFDNWQTFRRCLTNPFLKVAVEDFAAKNDLDQYRNYLTRNGEKKCLEKK